MDKDLPSQWRSYLGKNININKRQKVIYVLDKIPARTQSGRKKEYLYYQKSRKKIRSKKITWEIIKIIKIYTLVIGNDSNQKNNFRYYKINICENILFIDI